ncbi:MAG: hypothetical protein H6559_21415 [Lewinellaceae bacterium]|nr:hypothetical protein [Lewinellaceae bacterium]
MKIHHDEKLFVANRIIPAGGDFCRLRPNGGNWHHRQYRRRGALILLYCVLQSRHSAGYCRSGCRFVFPGQFFPSKMNDLKRGKDWDQHT